MTQDHVALLFGGCPMLLIAPSALAQFGQKYKQVQDGDVRKAMLEGAPDTTIKPKLLMLGLALALGWAGLIVLVAVV